MQCLVSSLTIVLSSSISALSHCALAVSARWFCVSRKGGAGEVGGVAWGHQQGAVHMVGARLDFEKAMVGTGGPPPTPTAWTGLENTTLTLQRAGFWQERRPGL